jgi:hypothetical protein
MNVLLGLLILAVLLSMMAAMFIDLDDAYTEAQQDALLDELWDDE